MRKRGNIKHLEIIMEHLSNTPGKGGVEQLQPTAILDTAHILRRALTEKYKTCVMVSTIACTKL
jgi:hypothetical protein